MRRVRYGTTVQGKNGRVGPIHTMKFPISLTGLSTFASSNFSADLGPTPGTSVNFATSWRGVLWKFEFF